MRKIEKENIVGQDDRIVQKRLAFQYQHGIGANQDDNKALHCYTLAAEQGDVTAQKQLIAIYSKKGDEPQSLYWAIRMKAKEGRAGSQYRLGCYYARGQFVERDYVLAMSWWKKAALQKNLAAQYCLGKFFMILADMKNRSQNLSMALYWFQQMKLMAPLIEEMELKHQGIVAVERSQSCNFTEDFKTLEIKHLSPLFSEAKKLYFANRKQKINWDDDWKKQSKVQEFIQYSLQTASKIPADFKLQKDYCDNVQKIPLLKKNLATFPKDIMKCRIPIPFDFANYEDAIIEVPKDYYQEAPLLKDIPRNQSPKQLLLVGYKIIEEGAIRESEKLDLLITSTKNQFIQGNKVLLKQQEALLIEKNHLELKNAEEKGLVEKLADINMQILTVEKEIKNAENQQAESIDKLLTQSLTDEKSELSIFTQILGVTAAKQVICCFNQRILYTINFLQNLIIYLENQKPINQHKNIYAVLIHFVKMVTNISVENDRPVFTSFLKGIRYQCMESDNITPGMKQRIPDCEIRVDYHLIASGVHIAWIPQLFTSNINLAKQFFKAFCAGQIRKIGEMKEIRKQKFLLKMYKTVLTELPEELNFILHLTNMARLSHLPESRHTYLAACYLKKRGLFADLNPEKSSLDDMLNHPSISRM